MCSVVIVRTSSLGSVYLQQTTAVSQFYFVLTTWYRLSLDSRGQDSFTSQLCHDIHTTVTVQQIQYHMQYQYWYQRHSILIFLVYKYIMANMYYIDSGLKTDCCDIIILGQKWMTIGSLICWPVWSSQSSYTCSTTCATIHHTCKSNNLFHF